MCIDNLYLIRTKVVQDEPLEFKIMKSLEATFPKYKKSKVATIEIEDQELFIPFLTEDETKHLIKIFKSQGILIGFENISHHILMGEPLDSKLSKLFSIEEFDLLRQKYIAANLTVDIVLDKISSMGIDSLTDIDYKILNS